MMQLFRPSTIQNFSKQIARCYATASKTKKPSSQVNGFLFLTNIVIVRASRDEFPCILDLMHKAYYPSEPSCMCLAFRSNVVFDEEVTKGMSEGMTLVAKCKCSGDILGAAINTSASPWDPDMKDKLACNIACPKSRKLLHFYAYMQRAPDLWKKCGVQKIFEIEYVFVKTEQRGKGLASILMRNSRALGADCGYNLIRVDCTNHYSAKICENMKMELAYEIPYCSYVGEDHKPIFNTPKPHDSVKVYVDEDPQKNYKK